MAVSLPLMAISGQMAMAACTRLKPCCPFFPQKKNAALHRRTFRDTLELELRQTRIVLVSLC